ncbi:14490_t:CDS:2, partial [Entrophospora sp. SA101]
MTTIDGIRMDKNKAKCEHRKAEKELKKFKRGKDELKKKGKVGKKEDWRKRMINLQNELTEFNEK